MAPPLGTVVEVTTTDEPGPREDHDHRDDPGHLDDPDDLEGVDTPMSRLAGRWGRLLALLLAVLLAIPVGGWLLDELAFDVFGRAVEAEIDDPTLTEAVLLVRSVGCSGRVSTGSAFAVTVDSRPVVVTNRHVVDDARVTSVRPLDGGAAVRVDGHRLSPGPDVAVLDLDAADRPPPLRIGEPVSAGDEVRTIGFPGARPSTTTGTVVSAEGGRLELDLVVDPGASGSPVVDTDGRVVGQVFARTADGRGIATDLNRLVSAISDAQPTGGC